MAENSFSYTANSGKQYFLNVRITRSGGGKEVPFYYFTKTHKPDTAVQDFPAGYVVAESNGMPIMKRAAVAAPVPA